MDTDRVTETTASRRRVGPIRCWGSTAPTPQMWRINREAVLLGAGPAALLLQIAHPLIAEGVAQHSGFQATRSDACGAPRDDHGHGLRGRGHGRAGDPAAQWRPCRGAGSRSRIRTTRRQPARTPIERSIRALLLWVQATLVVDQRPGAPALGAAPSRTSRQTRCGRETRAVGVRAWASRLQSQSPGLAGVPRLLG